MVTPEEVEMLRESAGPPAVRLPYRSMAEAFQSTAAAHADRPAVRLLGDTVSWTWGEYADLVRRAAGGMAHLGIERGDTVALALTNRPEFHVADTAAMHLGAVPFSLYNTLPVDQIALLLRNSGARLVVCEDAFLADVEQAVNAVGGGITVCCIEGGGDLSWEQVLAIRPAGFDFEACWRAVESDDLLTLIYTSGTTGVPKGVEITHAAMLGTLSGYLTAIPFPADGRVLSWLPMAHIAERGCSHYLPMVMGYTSTSCPDATALLPHLREVRPTWFFAVPRAWEKLRAGILAMSAQEPDEQKRAAVAKAIEVGLQRVRLLQADQPVPDELAAAYQQLDALVLSRLRAAVGLDALAVVNVGAAPSAPEVLEFFHAIGIPVAELWGMSESCAAGCVNPAARVKIGTVGLPLPGFTVRVADDGELLLTGPGLMRGYRGDPDLTAVTLGDEGWLLTGDVGSIDDEGYVTIVDRKKELIITSAGKNLSPTRIETLLKGASPVISQAVAVGDGRRYVVALLTIDDQALAAWGAAQGLAPADPAALRRDPRVQDEIRRAVDSANRHLARVEQIKDYAVLDGDWLPGGEELTPTSKLRRRIVMTKYADVIEPLYADATAPFDPR